jgi:hypothetical protein
VVSLCAPVCVCVRWPGRQYLAQDVWQSIVEYAPDLWLWLGDVVYTDRMVFPGVFRSSPVPEIQRMYARQKSSPLYSQLRESTPIIGTWVCMCAREV